MSRFSSGSSEQVGINVKDFGAVGNGVKNDTKAILSAIAALESHKSTLIFPRGVYVVDGLEIADKTAINIIGDGATLMLADQTNTSVLTLSRCPYSQIVGLRIDGNKKRQTGSALGNGLVFRATYFSIIDRVYISNCKNSGIMLVGYYDGTLFRGCDEVHITNSFFQSNNGAGVMIDSVADVNIHSSNIEFNAGNGVTVLCSTDIPSGNIDISHNQILSNEGHGVEVLDGSSRSMINSNHVRNNGKTGIRYVTGKQFWMMNNNIHLNGRVDNYSAGILVGYTRSGIISGNMISCTDFPATQGFAIDGSDVSDIIITQNIMRDNLVTGINLPNSTNIVMTQNIGAD